MKNKAKETFLLLLFSLCLVISIAALTGCKTPDTAIDPPIPEASGSVLVISFLSETLFADLYDNATARDFLTLLPASFGFDDYNASEKTANLSDRRRLDVTDAPAGYRPSAGEFGYYAPWGNLVAYHADFTYAQGIVPMGKVRGGWGSLRTIEGAVTIRFSILVEN